ncbi:MAG TPA: SAM-dependent methyltransferase [Acidothermaceae bacterium]|nr:SAM-dependent methyltransferase [Acidothermaceae bacterium]
MSFDQSPSRTALSAAAARAAHLIVDAEPRIFADPLAERLLGDRAEELLGYHRAHGGHPILASARAQVVCRSTFAESRLATAVARGVDQYVILGAGLDTFAYRAEVAARLRTFEVDRSLTQEWKHRAIADAGLAPCGDVVLVATDFADESLVDALTAAGFDRTRPAFVSWLGVSMYLAPESVATTLDALGSLAPGTELVLDYLLTDDLQDDVGRLYAQQVSAVAADQGEPWLSTFSPEAMAKLLAHHAFVVQLQADQRHAIDAALWRRTDALAPSRLAMLAHATIG